VRVSGGCWGNENLLRSSAEYSRSKRDPLTNGRKYLGFPQLSRGFSSSTGVFIPDRFFAAMNSAGFRGGELLPTLSRIDGCLREDSFMQSRLARICCAVNTEYRVPVRAHGAWVSSTLIGCCFPTGSERRLHSWRTNDFPRSHGFRIAMWASAVSWKSPCASDLAVNSIVWRIVPGQTVLIFVRPTGDGRGVAWQVLLRAVSVTKTRHEPSGDRANHMNNRC